MLSYVQARTPRGERCFRHGSARTHGRDDSSAACASSVAASTEWAVCRRCCRRGRAALRFGASEKEHRQESQHGPPGKKRREANIAADLSPCFANFPCCRRRVSPCSLYGRLRSLECAARCALCRRKLCGRGDIQTTLEYYGFSTSLYQFRLNVRYTTGRSASLLLAPVVGRSKGPRAAWPGHSAPFLQYRVPDRPRLAGGAWGRLRRAPALRGASEPACSRHGWAMWHGWAM